MKKYLSFSLSAAIFMICVFYMNSASAAGSKCSSNDDCGSGNCVADQCYDNTISSPCLSSAACASKNCYAGRCCPQTYPMEGSCPKKSMAQPLPALNNSEDAVVLEPEATQEKDVGMRFSGMAGQVEWRADDDPDGWKLCKMGDKLPVFAHIRTQENSSAILSFSDMSTFVLKPESEVVLDTPPGPESKIKLVAGNIWVNVKKMVNEGSMSVEMNQAVCGIKGTTFVLSDKDGISSIKVIEGLVDFTSKADGRIEKVATGEAVVADKNGLGIKSMFDVSAENKIWEDVNSKINNVVGQDINEEPLGGFGSNLNLISDLILLSAVSIFAYIKMKK